MPSLYDMLNLYLIDQFFNRNPATQNEVTPTSKRKVPIICIYDKHYSSIGAKRVLLPTIPVWHGRYACRAYHLFSEPMMSFAPGIFNAREFKNENLCESTDSYYILTRLMDLLPFSEAINFVVTKTIEPWMHDERERLFLQTFGGQGN